MKDEARHGAFEALLCLVPFPSPRRARGNVRVGRSSASDWWKNGSLCLWRGAKTRPKKMHWAIARREVDAFVSLFSLPFSLSLSSSLSLNLIPTHQGTGRPRASCATPWLGFFAEIKKGKEKREEGLAPSAKKKKLVVMDARF